MTQLKTELEELIEPPKYTVPSDMPTMDVQPRRHLRGGDSKLQVRFYNDHIEFFAERWHKSNDDCGGECSHGYEFRTTRSGEQTDDLVLRSDCGDADIKEAQVKELHERLGTWLKEHRKWKRLQRKAVA